MWVKRNARTMRGIRTATALMQLHAFCFGGNRAVRSLDEGQAMFKMNILTDRVGCLQVPEDCHLCHH